MSVYCYWRLTVYYYGIADIAPDMSMPIKSGIVELIFIDAIIKFEPLPRLPAAPTLLKHIK